MVVDTVAAGMAAEVAAAAASTHDSTARRPSCCVSTPDSSACRTRIRDSLEAAGSAAGSKLAAVGMAEEVVGLAVVVGMEHPGSAVAAATERAAYQASLTTRRGTSPEAGMAVVVLAGGVSTAGQAAMATLEAAAVAAAEEGAASEPSRRGRGVSNPRGIRSRRRRGACFP